MGQPLYLQLPMLACGEREAMVMATPHTHDSALLPCFHGCPAFLHRHFPSQSPPSHPLDCSFPSQQQTLPRDCSTIPKLQLPAAAPSSGPVSLPRVCMAAARTVWFSFHVGCHRSAVLLSALNVSPLTQTIAPTWGLDPCFSSPTRQGQVHPNTPVFPPSSFVLLSFTWFYIFSSAGQVLLSALSLCSSCTSVSEGVFLMYLWRETCSTSTYSSAILFLLPYYGILCSHKKTWSI